MPVTENVQGQCSQVVTSRLTGATAIDPEAWISSLDNPTYTICQEPRETLFKQQKPQPQCQKFSLDTEDQG